MKTIKYKIGIDEVGRGPIAGPVAVCAFCILSHDHEFIIEKFKTETNLPIRDSKKLTKKQREIWFEFLKKQKDEGVCNFVVSFVSSEMIDKFGIAKCIKKALNESLQKVASGVQKTSRELANSRVFTPEGMKNELLHFSSGSEGNHIYERQRIDDKGNYADDNLQVLASLHILLDGGLKAPEEYINQETFIKGDELHPVISLASIVAKVSRDRVMETFAKKYPLYGFEKHAGYGTKAHYEAIKKHGQTPIHRKSFIH